MSGRTIICVTPNVALDRTLVVPDFALGQISRIRRGVVVPGGKGLNMMRAVRILGGDAMSMGLLGGHTGRMVANMVTEDGYRAEWTWFQGETRTCTIIAGPGARSTVINESGQIDKRDWNALADDICRVATEDNAFAVCLCGSLPDGAPDYAPGDLIHRLCDSGIAVWADTSGRALTNAIAAEPYAIKVNSEELAAALNIDANCQSGLLEGAKALLNCRTKIVVISRGAQGAWLLTAKVVAEATPPRIQPVDPVASGDCLHAGIVVAMQQGCAADEAIRRGVAAGTVNALYAGGGRFTLARYKNVLKNTTVERIAL